MNGSRYAVLSVLLAAALTLGFVGLGSSPAQQAPATGGTKMAACDVVMVMRNYKRAQEMTRQFTQRRESLDAEDREKEKAIENLQMTLEGLLAGSPEYEKQLNKLQELTIQRQVWLQMQNDLAIREHHRLTKEMYKEVLEAIAKVARAKGIDMVMFQMTEMPETRRTEELLQFISTRGVLYASESADITQEVLQQLNGTAASATQP